MPSRKKSNLSQSSRNAKRMRLIRSRESEEDRERLLALERVSRDAKHGYQLTESVTPSHASLKLSIKESRT
ncbi:unnamed protein product [Euphydryas editha]|uniref:Uncharacterized protein n=1 Tax=Euphydryas editha TaxID=104508 RepID=A0AAU9UGE5_EUPED|nr:unnamed protein product [Euphydryas editha]